MMYFHKLENINSVITVLLLCANPIAWIAMGGLLPIICVVCLSLILIVNRSIPRILLPLFLFCLIAFILSSQLKENVNGNNEYFSRYWTSFFSIGITGFICGILKRNIILVFKILAIFGVLYVPFLLKIEMGNPLVERVDYAHWMGVSYGLLRIINGLLITIIFFTKNIIIRVIEYIALIGYSAFLLVYGSRGTFLAIMVLVLFLWIIKKNYSFKTIKKMAVTMIIPVASIIIFFFDILLYINNITNSLGFKIRFAEKMLKYHELGTSLTNGRDNLFMNALNGSLDSPLFGHGIATFEPYNDGYAHNVFLQLFYELGIFPFLLLCAIVWFALYYILNNKKDPTTRLFLAYLFSSGLMDLVFSSSFWLSQVFWMFIAYVYSQFYNTTLKCR